MGRSIGAAVVQPIITNLVAVGAIAPVFRSGDAYKAVGESVSRAAYPVLSAAFPRNGSVSATLSTMTLTGPKSVAYGNGIVVAVGPAGTTSTATYSRDGGKTWRNSILPSTQTWTSVTFGNGKFVAVSTAGAGAISSDGLKWAAILLPFVGGYSFVCYGAGVFLALGYGSGAIAATSPDGVTWTPRAMPTTATWSAAKFGGGKFVAVSQGTAGATSADGFTWVPRTLPAGVYGDIDYGLGVFVATGYVGSQNLATSPDGVSWTPGVLPGNLNGLSSVAYGDGVFWGNTANGADTQSCVSYDGLVWIEKTTPYTGSGACEFCAGVFVSIASANALLAYVENLETSAAPSDYLYLSGAAGQFIRVK